MTFFIETLLNLWRSGSSAGAEGNGTGKSGALMGHLFQWEKRPGNTQAKHLARELGEMQQECWGEL